MNARRYTCYFAFCGSGGGAVGFQRATTRLLGREFGFRVLGGFDIDPKAIANFEYLTSTKGLVVDARTLTNDMLRASANGEEPDAIFGSAPCVGATKLITDELANTEHYQKMNELMLVWTRLMLDTWRPRLVVYENVPNVVHRAKKTIGEVFKLMRRAGYLATHEDHELGAYGPPDVGGGFYDAGSIGGLAQRRKRWLACFRLANRCAPLVYKPVQRRIRGVGEVIGPLPLPGDPAGGPMHKLPNLSVMNWLRLALIPAGGDWRDLPGVLDAEQKRRELFRREHLARWEDPSVTIGGPGSNGPYGVADPRVIPQAENARPFDHKYRVEDWQEPSHAVTSPTRVGSGAPSVADPRVPSAFKGAHGVTAWTEPASAIIGESLPPNGPASVADPRLHLGASAHTNILHVGEWEEAARAVTGAPRPSNGAASVADPRLSCEPHSGAYGVTGWTDPAHCITGSGQVDNARQAVADPRAEGFRGVLGVVPWDEAAGCVTGNARPKTGSFTVADPRVPRAFDRGYAVVGWEDPSNTVAGVSDVGCGTYSVADPRPQAPAGWLTVDDIMVFLETQGPWAIVDKSSDGPPLAIIRDLKKPSPISLRIVARDGTWHRPFTTYELAILQGLPAHVNGEPLRLTGPATVDRKQIGNLVPPPAALAIGVRFLVALAENEFDVFSLSGAGGVWVDPETFSAENLRLAGLTWEDIFPIAHTNVFHCGALQ